MSRVSCVRGVLVAGVIGSSFAFPAVFRLSAGAGDERNPSVANDLAAELVTARIESDEKSTSTLRQALLRKVQVEAEEVPLRELLTKLAKECGLQLTFDTIALADEGVQLDHPVSLKVENITLQSALRLICQPLQLTYVFDDGVLFVTTWAKAGEMQETRVYNVGRLLPDDDFTPLIELISSCVQPVSWDEVGGPAGVRQFRASRAIIVRQSQAVHDEIASLLQTLERVVRFEKGKSLPVPPEPDPIRDAELAIRKKLNNRCTVDIVVGPEPLDQALSKLAKEHKFPLWFDKPAISDEGVAYNQEIPLKLHDVRLETALKVLLDKLQMSWVIEDEVLKITTVTKAAEKLVTRVYDVGDLVAVPTKELRWPPATVPYTGPAIGGAMGGGGIFSLPVLHLKQGFASPGGGGFVMPRGRPFPVRQKRFDFTQLIEIVTSTVEPESWDEVGGSGNIRQFGSNVLVMRQTREIHEKIETLIYQLRKVAAQQPATTPQPVPDDPSALTLFVYHFTDSYSYSTDSLAELIPQVVVPESWKAAGGKGTLIVQPTCLVIHQTPAVHKQIVRLLYDVVMQSK